MKEFKNQALNGKDNKRINTADQVKSEGTAAWTDTEQKIPESNVSIPNKESTIRAKNWVDDGSRL